MEQIIKIAEFIFKSFIHIWPYLLVTIPLAIIVNLTGASRFINKAFGKNPLLSVFLATVVGAFSPFCSCGVIPVISSLLLGGVPLAPVMSFWIASPSMDPEIFFLSSSVLGWDLAVWRLAATFVISLSAGYITYVATIKGFISAEVIKTHRYGKKQFSYFTLFKSAINDIIDRIFKVKSIAGEGVSGIQVCCTTTADQFPVTVSCNSVSSASSCKCENSGDTSQLVGSKRILREIFNATFLITKFMGIAFMINALITLYVPKDLITGLISGSPSTQVILATLTGIPLYTSNITALPIVRGLIDLGLNKGAALSFLIAGSATTLPAMIAVWGIAKKRVFLLYIMFALLGSLFSGLIFNLFI